MSKIWPGQNFETQGHYSKFKGQIKVTLKCCTPTPPTNVPTKYQVPTPYGFRDIARTRFYSSRSLWQGQRSNQGHTMMFAHLHPRTNVPTKYQLPTPYSFSLDKLFPATCPPVRPPVVPHAHLDTMGEYNTLTAINVCGVKTSQKII